MILMKDYSSTAFKMAMCSHFCRYGMPVVVTADNGSQIRRAAGEGDSVEMGNTSGALTAKDTSKNVALPGIFDWCTQAKGWLKGVLVYLAPTEAQHRSGTVESHIRQVKHMMRSSARRIRKESFHPFSSLFELDLLLVKISGLLNSRPIWGNETGLVTIQDLLNPKITVGEKLTVCHNDLMVKDDIYKIAFAIFSEEVVCGNLTKCGKRAYTESPVIKQGTVVLVIFPSKCKWKYGQIVRPVTDYKYEVKMAEQGNFKRVQIHDRCNIVSLFMPRKNQEEGI